MAAIVTEAGEVQEAFSEIMLDLLWGIEQPPVPTAMDHAYRMIWQQIVTGEHGQGARLNDSDLATRLGLSRTPVRQALYRLAQEGLVRADARHGFSVRTFTVQDVHEIYDVRRALEMAALRLAIPNLTMNELTTELDAVHTLQATFESCSVAVLFQSDLRFHKLLIHGSRNGRLIRFLATLRSQSGIIQYWDTSYRRRNRVALDEHQRVLQALVAGKTGEAEALLDQHLINSKNGVLADLFDIDAGTAAVGSGGVLGASPGSQGRPLHDRTAGKSMS